MSDEESGAEDDTLDEHSDDDGDESESFFHNVGIDYEYEEDDSSDDETLGHSDSVIARDGTTWIKQTSHSRRGPRRGLNVFSANPRSSTTAHRQIQSKESPADSLRLFIDRQMLLSIQRYTIAEAKRKNARNWTLSLEELEAYLGLLLARGLIGAKNIPLDDLWSDKWGFHIFGKTMPHHRFKEIQRYIRFDDRVSRRQRLQSDKFTLFSEVWDMFVANCRSHYMPNENLTVDEQLFTTKCRCRFTQFMPNKPDKYGIKIWI